MRALTIVFAMLAVAFDFVTGPGLQFPVLFVLPVLLAANALVRICVLVVVGVTVVRLVRARQEVRTLRGIIPVCAECKKIRDSDGQWNEMEIYITTRSEAEFSHGMCPACFKAYYGNLESDNS